jgi:hypothetical protein
VEDTKCESFTFLCFWGLGCVGGLSAIGLYHRALEKLKYTTMNGEEREVDDGLGNPCSSHQLTLPFTGTYNNSLLHRRRLRALSCHKLEESLSYIFSSLELREHESWRLVMLGHGAHSFTCIAKGVCWRVRKVYKVEFWNTHRICLI